MDHETHNPDAADHQAPEPEPTVTPPPDASGPAGGGDPSTEVQGQVRSNDTAGPDIAQTGGGHSGEEPATDSTSAPAPPEHHGDEVGAATGGRTPAVAPEEAVTPNPVVADEVEPVEEVEEAELPDAAAPDDGAVDARATDVKAPGGEAPDEEGPGSGVPEAEAVEPELPEAAVPAEAAATDAAAADTAEEEVSDVADGAGVDGGVVDGGVVDGGVVDGGVVDGSVVDGIVPAAKLMGAPAWRPRTVRTTKGIRRILAVAVVAMVAFGFAIVTLADDARRGCIAEAQRDPTYQAKLLGKIQVERTDYDLAVTHNGTLVKGAKVCASVAMRGMTGMAVSQNATEAAPGIYKVTVVLEMSGSWRGSILITERGKPPVSVPLSFDVA